MRRLLVALSLTTASAFAATASAQTIDTYAGGAVYANQPALDVALNGPYSVAYGPDGAIYTVNSDQHKVERFDPATNLVTTVAGNGSPGYSGDGGPATSASLTAPVGVAVDAAGNLYIADLNNQRVRKVAAATGLISTVAGNGTNGFSGDGGAAGNASLYNPYDVAVDAAGDLFIADLSNNRIRKVAAGTGIITTVAGNGTQGDSGDGGAATSASLNLAYGVAVDAAGNLYIADSGNNAIRKVAADTGIITTVAGNGTAGYAGDGGAATSASLRFPSRVAVDAVGNLYIADTNNQRIRRVAAATGIITTVAGNGGYGFSGDGGAATSANLSLPYGVAVDAAGDLYIGDLVNWRLRKVTVATGLINTVVGNGTQSFSGNGVAATSASLSYPYGVAADAAGNLYIADLNNQRVRKVAAATGLTSTVAGNGTNGFSGDGGAAGSASLGNPWGVAVDAAGNAYIADYSNHRIRKVAAGTGLISTVAGNGNQGYTGDGGAASSASLLYPSGVAVDAAGNLYIADSGNQAIRKVAADTGFITTVAGNGTPGFSGDGGAASNASLYNPYGVAVDAAGNLYIADQVNSRIRKVESDTGIISTVAGNGTYGSSGDDGAATDASLNYPYAVAVDVAGNLYIADTNNQRIRRVASDTGIITTVAGNGTYGFSGDGGVATSANLANPSGVAVDGAGNVYIADTSNNRIRRVIGLASPPDVTPPVIEPAVVGTLGTNAWYTGNVSVSWTVTDAESTVTTQTGCDASSVTADTAGVTFTCTATSAGGAATESVTVKRDATAPVAAATPSPVPNGQGWNNTNVTVHFAGTDLTSGVATCTADILVATEGENQQSGSGTCTDNAGNVSAPAFASNLNIDKTAPIVSGIALPPPNGSGWRTIAPVTVSFAGLDGLSGVPVGGCTAPVVLLTDGSGQSASGTCADLAGNLGFATVSGINIDSTAPVAVATASPAPNANGWNNTNVTVSFAGTDGLSGSGLAPCSAPTTLTSEGASQSASGICNDVAGNTSNTATVTVSIDKTAPTVSIVMPPVNSGWPVGASIRANYTCQDSLSGVVTTDCTGPVATGTSIDTATAGAKSFTVNATDRAGNSASGTSSYNVSTNSYNSPGIIWTYAGNGAAAFSGDDGAASSASLSSPQAVAVDSDGNVYIADQTNGRVRRVTPAGVISTVAGNGTTGFSGDGGAATSAALNNPFGLAVDGVGNLFIADLNNNRIRKVTPGGIISTVAGNGTQVFSGDGGPAVSAGLSAMDVALDAAGNLYIADFANRRVRRVDAVSGVISTAAGNGVQGATGDGGPATSASLNNPTGVAIDAAGALYIADVFNQSIRKVTVSGTISTVAGTGTFGFSGDGGPATSAQLASPRGIAIDSPGNLYIADETNQRIRKVSTAGDISTVVGIGPSGFAGDGGAATDARLRFPARVAFDSAGNLYIADRGNNRVRRVAGLDASGAIVYDYLSQTVYSGGSGYANLFEVAQAVSLSAPNRAVTQFEFGYSAPLGNADYVVKFYALDGPGGSPGSVVWSSPVSTAPATVHPATAIASISVPSVAVPQSFAWSIRWTGAPNGQGLSIHNGAGPLVGEAIRNWFLGTDSSWISANPGNGFALAARMHGIAGPIDATPPEVQSSATGTLGTNGWYISDVNVSWTVTDSESNVTTQTGCDASSVTADTAGAAFTCTATSAGGTATRSVTVKRDATAPVATATPLPVPNGQGWNNTNVTVRFAGTDPTSGVAACTADILVATEGENQQSGSGSCTDNAGNVSAPALASNLNIDKTAPIVSGIALPPPNGSDWRTTAPVTVSFAGLDGLSGVPVGGCTAPVVLLTDGSGQSASGTCADLAGNLGFATVSGINIDSTAPVAVATASPAPNANGWNNTNVTVSFSGTDSLTGSGVASCSPDVVLTTEGANLNASGACQDVATNRSAAATLNIQIDTTPPSVPSILTPVPNDGFVLGEVPTADYSCLDSLSGIATCSGPVESGGTLDTSVLGTKAFSVTATDRAGNARSATDNYNVNPPNTVIITTVAGNGTQGYSGDGGAATSASFHDPQDVAVDAIGSRYIVDTWNHRIRKVGSDGVVTTIAGDGAAGFSGDGGLAVSARLNFPFGVAVDAAGNIYIADRFNNRIRKLALGGTISTVAGNGAADFNGDGGPATEAAINHPWGIAVDLTGSLYIADTQNSRVRKVSPSGIISTVAGNGTAGFSGDGGAATIATIGYPWGIAVDLTGSLYIADGQNNRVRKVSPSGIISTVAGNGTSGSSGDGGQATGAGLGYPSAVDIDTAGNIYIADAQNQRIRKVTPSGIISTVAGNGTAGFGGDGGAATSANLVTPTGASVDAAGNIYVADSANQRIRRIRDTTYTVSPMAVFGSQTLSVASSPRTVTLTNRGVLPVPVTSITITGANPGQFSQTNNCGITTQVAVNTTCAINVVFRPTSNGVKTAVLTVNASGGLGSKSVALYGTGGPTFTVAPNAISFDSQTVTVASPSQNVTLTNTGTLPLPIASVALNGGNANQFSQTNTCGTSVPANATCSISIRFLPTTVGAKTTTLNVSAGGGIGTQSVSLAGTGTPPTYALSWAGAPNALTFSDQATNVSSAALSITLTNTGPAAVPITSITDTGTNANQFTETHNCGTSVPVGASCRIDIVFRPTAAGTKTAALNVNAGSGAGTQSVNLAGTGIVPTYSLSPPSLPFPDQAVSVRSQAVLVTVTNTGVLPLPITNVTRSGTNANQFADNSGCGASVAVGQSCTISVSFLPTTAGTKSATLNVVGGASAGTQSVALSGTGVVPTYGVAPSTLSFGSQIRNTTSAPQLVTVTNTSTVQLPISRIALGGTNPGQFSQTNDCASPIAAGASCTISVQFQPTSAGAKAASLNVNTGGGAGTKTVTLSGTGT